MAGGGELRRQVPAHRPGAEDADAHLQLRFYLWCNIAPAGFLNEFPLVFKDLHNPALLSLGGTGTAGYTPKSLIYI